MWPFSPLVLAFPSPNTVSAGGHHFRREPRPQGDTLPCTAERAAPPPPRHHSTCHR